jgi:hypothetical protein
MAVGITFQQSSYTSKGIILTWIKNSPPGPDPAQGFLGDAQVGGDHTEWYAVVDIMIRFAEMPVLFFRACEAHGGYSIHEMSECGAHRQTGVTFHFRELVEKVDKVIYMKDIAITGFQSVDKIDIRFSCPETTRRIHPFMFGREIFGDLFAILQEIQAHHSLSDEIAFRANTISVMDQFPFPE